MHFFVPRKKLYCFVLFLWRFLFFLPFFVNFCKFANAGAYTSVSLPVSYSYNLYNTNNNKVYANIYEMPPDFFGKRKSRYECNNYIGEIAQSPKHEQIVGFMGTPQNLLRTNKKRKISKKSFFSIRNSLKHNRILSNMCRYTTMKAGICTSSWNYRKQGNDWGDFFKHNCKNRQSPINISNLQVNKNEQNSSEKEILLVYRKCERAPLNIEWNNYSIQVSCSAPGDMGFVEMAGKKYEVVQFHFHGPSEHTFDEIRRPLELHIVSQATADDLLVVGVTFNVDFSSPEVSPPNKFLQALLDIPNMPPAKKTGDVEDEKNTKISLSPENVPDELNLSNLFTQNAHEFYTYLGSLTTPPCSENVTWYVMKNFVVASKEQLKKLIELLSPPETKGNYRSVQNNPEDDYNNQRIYSVVGKISRN